MQIRGTDQRAVAQTESAGLARLQWLVRKLSRRDGAALALPLSLALLGSAIARERDSEERVEGGDAGESGPAAPSVNGLQAGERVALMAGNEVLVEHLLTEADVAAGQVRVALRMIDSARMPGMRIIEAADAATQGESGSASAQDLDAAVEAAEAQAQAGSADAVGAEGDARTLAEQSGAQGDTSGAAAGAAEQPGNEDDDDRGLLWLVLGLSAVGTGLVIAHDNNDSGPQVHTISGHVVKGYVQGAAVYLDLDHDGLPDGDPVYTDANGRFTLQTTDAGASIVVYGGVDTLTNVPLEGLVLRAPAGSTVVTPLTTLLDEMMRQEPSLNATTAQAKLLEAFGLTLPAGTDLRTYDAVAGIATGGAPIEDQSEVVLNTISAIQSILTGAGAAGDLSAANTAITALAQAALQSTHLDLTDVADMQAVLQSAFAGSGVGASDAADLAALATAIATVNGALTDAAGLGESALQATRYAFSGFQDLLTSIGASAHASGDYERDISFSTDPTLANAVSAINGGSLAEVISGKSGLSISFTERLEDGRFVLALNPELKFHEGAPDTIDTVTVRFDVKHVVVQMELRGLDGQISAQTLVPDAGRRYTLAYGDLDKIFFQAPENFNGTLGAEVGVHYVGLNITDTPPKVGIRIDAVNDAPTSANATVSAVEDETYVFGLSDFPFDDQKDGSYASGANQLAEIRIVSLPQTGTLYLGEDSISADDLLAGFVVNAGDIADGRLRFVPDADGNGDAYASFQFQVRDDGGTAKGGADLDPAIHTLTVNVAPVSDAPVVTSGAVSLDEDAVHAFSGADFGFTDVDGGEALAAVIITSLPGAGSLQYDGTDLHDIDVAGDGFHIQAADLDKLVFVPAENYNGPASFTYKVQDSGSDGANVSATSGTLSISVNAVSDVPTATTGLVQINEDGQHAFHGEEFGFTDVADGGDALAAVIITSLPSGGTLVYDGEEILGDQVAGEGFSVAADSLGKLVFVPNANYNGTASFGYRVQDTGTDGANVSATSGTLSIVVNAVSDAPTAVAGRAELNEDGLYAFQASDFGFSDVDGDELTAVIITALPTNGRLVYDGQDVASEGFSVAAENLGLLAFVPGENYNGTDSFRYKVQDAGPEGSNFSSDAILKISVAAISDAPTATTGSVAVDEDGEHGFQASDFGFTDVADGGDALTAVIITSLPENGTLVYDGTSLIGEEVAGDGFSIAVENLDKLVFVPNANFNGPANFGYKVQDAGTEGANVSATSGTLSIVVNAVSDAPTVDAVPLTMDEDGQYTFHSENFGFSDVDGDELAAVIITGLPTNGRLVFDGQDLLSDNVAGEGFSVMLADLGKLVFVPTANYNGEGGGFSYKVQDTGPEGSNLSAESTLQFTVDAVSDAPTASTDPVEMDEDGEHTFQASDFGFSDVDGDELVTVLITGLPSNGTLVYDGNSLLGEDVAGVGFPIAAEDLGKLVFVPDADYNGDASFGYKVQDTGPEGSNLSAESTLQITVNAVTDVPVASGGTVSTIDEDTERSFYAEDFGFSDGDGDALVAVIITSLPSNGRLVYGEVDVTGDDVSGDGFYIAAGDLSNLVFVPDANYNGPATFNYKVQDSGAEGSNLSAEAAMELTIRSIIDAPEATPVDAEGIEDEALVLELSQFGFTDADGDTLVNVIITSLPEGGVLHHNGSPVTADMLIDGAYVVSAQDIESGGLQFCPAANVNGEVTFNFRLEDSGDAVNISTESTLTLDLNPVNDTPTINLTGVQTHEVNTLEDVVDANDGFLSLREALALAKDGDSITFNEALFDSDLAEKAGVIALASGSGPLQITSGVYINGIQGDARVTIEAENFNSALVVAEGVSGAVASGIKIVGMVDDHDDEFDGPVLGGRAFVVGEPGAQAAIVNRGELTLHNVEVTGYNQAHLAGGTVVSVLVNHEGASLTAFNLHLQNNTATGGNASDAGIPGGSAYLLQNAGTMRLVDSTIGQGNAIGGDSATGSGGNAYLVSNVGTGTIHGQFAEAFSGTTAGNTGLESEGNQGLHVGFEPVDPPTDLTYTAPAVMQPVYVEGEAGILLAPNARLADVELGALDYGRGDWAGASIPIERKSDGHHGWRASRSDDFDFLADDSGLRFENGQIIRTVGSIDHVIGTWTEKYGRLTIKFSTAEGADSAIASTEDVEAVLQHVTYRNRSDDPQDSVTLNVTVRDGNANENGAQGQGGLGEVTAEISVGLVNINDAPVARRNSIRIDEDGQYTFDASNFRFRDEEDDSLEAVIITGLPDNGTLYYCGEALTGEDLSTEDGGFRIETGDLDKLSFEPEGNFHGTVSFSYLLQDNGGTVQGGRDTSGEATFRISVRSVNDEPVFSIPDASESQTPQADCGLAFRVNTPLEGSQENPRIAALADGGYVVVWSTRISDGDVTDYDVHAQRFNAAGEKVGEEFRVNADTAGNQSEPTAFARADGGFGILWTSRVDGDANVQIRTYDADGCALGEEATVNSLHTTNNQIDPAVAAFQDGVVAVWTSDVQDGSGYGIYARVVREGVDVEFRVNTTTNFNQFQPAVAILADGSFVVTWTGQDGLNSQGVFSRRFAADGTTIDAQEQVVNLPVETDTPHQSGNQYQSVVTALSGGGHVVVWTGESQDQNDLTDVFAQRFGADGLPVGSAILVNAGLTADEQRDPSVVGLPTGGFMVTWTSWGNEDSSLDVFAQRFGTDGLPLGDRVLVNSGTDMEQTTPAISVLRDGTVVIAWQSNTDQGGDNYEVYAQHFQAMAPYFIEGATGNREDVVPVLIAPAATVSDTELNTYGEGEGDWTGAKLVIQREGDDDHGHGHHGWPFGFGRSPDHFEFQPGNGYSVDEQGALLKDGLLIGRLVESKGRLTVEFGTFGSLDVTGYQGTSTPTTADVNFVLQHIAYWNSSDNPGEGVTLQYRMEDGNGHWFGEQGKGGEKEGWASVEVQIININDAPEARHNSVLQLEDHSHTFDSGDFRFRDAEHDGLRSVTITSLPEGGKLLYCGRELTSEDLCGEGDGFTIEACDLDKLVFVPQENFHGQVEFSYILRDDGGTERGGQDTSEEATFRINVASVNDTPELDLRGYTFVVTTLEDVECADGKLSLREALAQACDGDSITFAAGLSGGTIEINGAPLEISKNVYINGKTGEDCEGITLSTSGAYTAIDVTACPTDGSGVVISGLSIAGDECETHSVTGAAGSFAAIINGGNLTLHDVAITGYNQTRDAGSEDVASVLWNKAGATLNASGLELEDNSAAAYSGADIQQGGSAYLIYNQGAMNLVDVCIDDNQVSGGNADPFNGTGGNAYLIYSAEGQFLAARDLHIGEGQAQAGNGAYAVSGDQGDFLLAGDECDDALPTSQFCYEAPDLRVQYTEDSEEAVRLMPHARVSDIELDARNGGEGDWSGASITVGQKSGDGDHGGGWSWGWWGGVFARPMDMPEESQDVLGLDAGYGLTFSEGQILKDCDGEPVAIGTYSVDSSGSLVIAFPKAHGDNAVIPTSQDVNNVLRLVTYRNTSQNPDETATIGITVNDGNGHFFGSQGLGGQGREIGEITVVLNSVNDAPGFDREANPPVVVSREEDETYVFSAGDFPFVDVEGDGLGGVVITALPQNGVLAIDGRVVTQEQVDCGGLFVSAADIACGLFTFQPAPDHHGVTSFEYKVRDDGGTEFGGEDTTADCETFTFDVRSINDAPALALSPTADYTYVVTTLDDSNDPCDGKISLREALAMACDGDSITFDATLLECGQGVITLASTLIIDKQVYINGALNDGSISLQRGDCMDGAIVEVTCEVGSGLGGAVLQGLVLDGDGIQTTSAALVNAGNLNLHEVTIQDQNTVNDCGDAVSALLNLSGGVVVATELTVTDNSATAGEGGDAYAILNQGKLTVDELSVTDNSQQGGSSSSGQGGDAFAVWNSGTYYEGGAEYCDNESTAGAGDDCGCDAEGDGKSGVTGGCEPAATGFDLVFVAPALTGKRPDVAIAYIAEGDAVRLAPEAVLSDVELGGLRTGEGNWSGARIEVKRAGGADTSDVFGRVDSDGPVQWNDETGQITKHMEGVDRVVGTFTSANGVMTIHFTGFGNAYPTTQDVNGILRSLTYSNSDSDFEGSVDLQVTVRDGNAAFDGPQGAGSDGAPGEGIVVGTIQVQVEQLVLPAPVSVELEVDTACADGVTGNAEAGGLGFKVTLPEGAGVGQMLRLYQGEVMRSEVELQSGDFETGYVMFRFVGITGLDDFEFTPMTARIAAGPGSDRESEASSPYFVTYDTQAPSEPILDAVPDVVLSDLDDTGSLLISGNAEAFSTVRIWGTVAENEGEGYMEELGPYTIQADADGRFSVVANLPGDFRYDATISLQAVATDRAGNESGPASYVSSMRIVDESNGAIVDGGDSQTTAGYVVEEGTQVASFQSASQLAGEEWFVAPDSTFATALLEGSSQSYTVTLLEGTAREDRVIGAPQHVQGALNVGQPLYHVQFWPGSLADTATSLFLQADAIRFSNGEYLRLSVDGIHVLEPTEDLTYLVAQGGSGDDRIVGSAVNDALFGGDGNNLLIGGAGNDILVSYGAADALQGDVLMGGDGNDILIALGDSSSDGLVNMYGGCGQDTFVVAPLAAAHLTWHPGEMTPQFNRDVTIHDFVIGEDRIDLSWVHVADESEGFRRINADDLGIDALVIDLKDDGAMEIDLSRFVTEDGTALNGTLTVQLAGGSAELTSDSFLLGYEMSMADGLVDLGYLDDALRMPMLG